MTLFLFKLFTTPALIALATLASRRYGQSIGGWLVGLPLTSGPIAVFLALEYGTGFSQDAALGSLQGTCAQALFVVAYCRSARRASWPVALMLGTAAFALGGALLEAFPLGAPSLAFAAVTCLSVGLWAVPAPRRPLRVASPPRWDLGARMVVATILVLLITSVAHRVGPETSGLLATFPLFGAVLGAFAHRQLGVAGAQFALRGLLLGLYAFTAFFVTVHYLVVPFGIAAAIGAAAVLALVVQGATFLVLERARRRAGRID